MLNALERKFGTEIRIIDVSDASDFRDILLNIDQEAKYTAFMANERSRDCAPYIEHLQMLLERNLGFIIGHYVDHKLVGYLSLIKEKRIKKNHIANLSYGVLKNYQGMGICQSLLDKMETIIAQMPEVKKIECTVVEENIASIRVLEKIDMKIEGIRRNTFFDGQKYYSEVQFGKIINS